MNALTLPIYDEISRALTADVLLDIQRVIIPDCPVPEAERKAMRQAVSRRFAQLNFNVKPAHPNGRWTRHIVLLLVLWTLGFGLPAFAAPIKPCDVVNAIVGEAAGQPYIVKLGVAEAIHNRGSLKGVYGLNAAHNRNEPAWVWRDARLAWAQCKTTHITKGATSFGNRNDVAKGTFAGLQLVCVLGAGKDATYFFKRPA